MRHLKAFRKLGRTSEHRQALFANMAASLITHGRIQTTLAKAKSLRPYVEKLVTLGKKGSLHHRRLAIAKIRDVGAVHKLFGEIGPAHKDRAGGYTRIIKLGQRKGDAAELAFIEFVEGSAPAAPENTENKPAEKA